MGASWAALREFVVGGCQHDAEVPFSIGGVVACNHAENERSSRRSGTSRRVRIASALDGQAVGQKSGGLSSTKLTGRLMAAVSSDQAAVGNFSNTNSNEGSRTAVHTAHAKVWGRGVYVRGTFEVSDTCFTTTLSSKLKACMPPCGLSVSWFALRIPTL